MEKTDLITIFVVYIIGFILSLIFLGKYGKTIGWDGYDPPHDDYYDDYSSNASAWFSFSLAWPLFYFIGILVFLYNEFIKFYKKIIL